MSNDIMDMSELYNYLKKQDESPNILTEDEFAKFIPLFNKEYANSVSRDNREEIDQMTNEFLKKVDMYNETHIVSSSGKVVRILPSILIQVQNIATKDVDKVDINIKMQNHNIPMYRSTAFADMINVLTEAQLSEENINHIKKQRQRYIELTTDSSSKPTLDEDDVDTGVFDEAEEL